MAFAAPGPMPRSGFGLHLPEIGPVRAAADQGIMSAVLPWGAIADRHGERVALPAGPAWATAILPLAPPPIRRSMGFLSGEEERRLLPLEPVAPSAPVLDLGRMSAATSAVYHSRFALNDAPLRKWSIGSTPKVETTSFVRGSRP